MTRQAEVQWTQWLAGVDGCRGGWMVALAPAAGAAVRLRVVPRFADIMKQPEQPVMIAVDMPIGLPARIGPNGRGPERAARALLGERQSSVFSVPSRGAVYAETFADACRIAQETSDPSKKVSKQLFMLAAKIREVDGYLRETPDLRARVFEVHPEVAFWRLNGERALAEPKKAKSRPYGPGLALRRSLLVQDGLVPAALDEPPPRGAGEDDVLDALACLAIARRIHAGTAVPFPDPPLCDDYGLPIAIWA